MQLFFSIIDAYGETIPWKKVVLPEGRTQKAAQCMIDVTKRLVRASASEGGDAGPSTPNKSKGGEANTPKTKTPKGQKVKETNGEKTPAPKRKRAAPKKKEATKKEENDEDSDLEDLIVNPPESKKVKTEEEETEDMIAGERVAYNLQKRHLLIACRSRNG